MNLQNTVQSLVYEVDIVGADGSEPVWSIYDFSGTHRIRVREIYTFLVPESKFEEAIPDECESEIIFEDVLEFDEGNGPIRLVRREVELEYEAIGTKSITIHGDHIHFDNAGLRCLSRPCGPAFAGGCLHRPSAIVKAIAACLRTPPDDEVITMFWQHYLWAALGGCYEQLFAASPDSLPAAEGAGVRVYYFHTEAFLPYPVQSRAASELDGLVFKGAFPLLAGTPDEQADLTTGYLRPLIWYPFVDEAFAFGAVTSDDRLHLFGRMGDLTRGYRITPATHWSIVYNEVRPLTFAEDVAPDGSFKYAEFDTGALPPGDFNIGLQQGSIRLHNAQVPFYIGAMPLADPERVGLEVLPDLHNNGDFAYLEGVLHTPIVFDPMVNCQACG